MSGRRAARRAPRRAETGPAIPRGAAAPAAAEVAVAVAAIVGAVIATTVAVGAGAARAAAIGPMPPGLLAPRSRPPAVAPAAPAAPPAPPLPGPVTTSDERERARMARLQETLGNILGRALGRLRVGMRVISARSGQVFFSRAGEALMDPASNQKVLATTAALMRLGPDWRFRTELAGPAPDGDGVVPGSLVLRGNGDPTLRAADLDALAAELVSRGVTRVDGKIIGDPRRIGDDRGDGGSRRAPLVVSRSIALVRVRPASAAGAPPLVLTDPSASAPGGGVGGGGAKDTAKDAAGGQVFVVRNAARTVAAGKNRVTVKLGIAGGRIVVDVAGTLVAGTPGLAFRRRVPQPALHAAMMMRQALVSAGIAVRGPAALGAGPGTAGFVEVHRSPPLSTLLRKINKDSDNDQAERVLEAVGAEVRGGAASTAKGLSVLRDVIGALGLPPRSYIPRNGSGLGHANRITADAMADLLRVLYLDPRVGPEIMQSLSVGGIDGTTRNRFKGTLAARRVRAKTGTLNGKSCLSGLVGDGDDVVAFAIMVQGIRGRRLGAVRAAQVGAVNAIMRYVREGAGHAVELPADFAEATVGRDFETGEEIMESEGEASESVPQAADSDEPGPPTSSR